MWKKGGIDSEKIDLGGQIRSGGTPSLGKRVRKKDSNGKSTSLFPILVTSKRLSLRKTLFWPDEELSKV